MSKSFSRQKPVGLPAQIVMLTSARTIINTGARMIYPLLPVFARGLDVEVATFAIILTILQLLGLTAPFIGQLSEQHGRRFTMLLGLGMYIVGMLLVFVSPNFVGLSAALILASLGKIAFDPAVQAYIGDRVPYQKRGLYMGILEFGWSGAFILGVPLMTWLIAQSNWQAPFATLAIFTGFIFVAAFLLLDNDRPEKMKRAPFTTLVRQSLNSKIAIAGLFLGFGMSGANQLISVVFGLWIEDSFGIQLAALAAASFVVGISELSGEGIVTVISDRFGKRRLIIISILANMVACLVLPFTAITLTTALIGLFFFYITFETALVASIPLASELSPTARGMYLTVFVAAVTLGRAIATPLSTALFTWDILGNALMAIVFNLIALIAVWGFIRIEE
ncbi:MAG: MFS transporter [Phototrophicaceae bacterium]